MEKFTPDSISSMTHRVKSLDWRNADSKWLYESAIKAINEKNNPQAVDLLVQSATIQANVSGPIHKDIGMCYQRMSNIYFAEGEFIQAIMYQHKAIIIFERALGLDHPIVAQSYITLSYLYQTVGRPDRSFKHIIRACDLFALNGCENSTEAVHALSTLAVLYTEADMHEFAIWTIHRVLDSYVLLNGEMHISVGECCQILACEYRAVKEYEKAVLAQARALSIFKQTLPETDKRIKDTKDLLEAYTRQITGVDLVPSSSSRSQNADKLVKSDRNSTLRQRLHMRKLQAKMNVPRSQLHLAYGDMHPQYTREQIEEEKTRLLIEEITRKNARK
jgi:protein TIF31